MLRPVAAGLMCLGFVTLGVAATWGQEETGKPKSVDLIVVEEAKEAAPAGVLVPVREVDVRTVEISVGDDRDAAVAGGEQNKRAEVREDGEVFILNEADGRIVQRIQANPQRVVRMTRAQFTGPAVIDAGTREAVNKLLAGLKEEAKRLAGEGKKEEAEKKMQSTQALEQWLNAGPQWGAYAGQPVPPGGIRASGFAFGGEGGPAAEEMKKLHAALEELRAKAAGGVKSGEEHARLQEQIAKIHQQIAEKHQRMMAAHAGMGPFPPGTPGMPMQPFAPGQPVPPGIPATGAGPGAFAHFFMRAASPEADALAQKSAALTQAAAQLQQAGLEEQSRDLLKQAEKLRAESEKIRTQQAPRGPAAVHFAGGPPVELQRSIHELQEQIQQLRKEVGELRELLQRRQ
jgi:hypothetical protein